MKTKRLLFGLAMTCAAASIATVGCAGNGSARNAGNTRVLNLDTTNCVNWRTDTIAGDPSQCKTGGFWSSTYNGNAKLCFGDFVFTHNSGFSIYSYWGGFTFGANGDSLCYTTNCQTALSPCAQSGSNGWIYNQWGVMAGGGIKSYSGDEVQTQKGLPYLIAYWDYYSDETEGKRSLEVTLADNSLFTPQEVYICNHPWPYYGNIYGDGFAHPFTKQGDRFDLWIHAVKANGREDSVRHNLAIYTNSLIQNPNWRRVNLARLFNTDNDSIKSLYFTMYSTDSDPKYGPNTAVYFCMDKLKVVKQDGTAAPAATLRAKAATAAKPAVEVKDYFPLTSYTGGDIAVHDANGKEVLKTTVKAGEKVNLSKLPAGEYRLRHGHRSIPLKKVK
jgi:hypothetical protein